MNIGILTNHHIVTLAVAFLEGDVNFIDREDIAIKANELAPGRFSWRKYKENIDLDAVGTALRAAKKVKNGSLLVGNNNEGWMLSPAGLQWFKSLNIDTMVELQHPNYRKDSINANLLVERTRLRTTRAYELFIENKLELLTRQDFYQFARVNEYYQKNTRKRRYSIIDNAVEGDADLTELWSALKDNYKEEMV